MDAETQSQQTELSIRVASTQDADQLLALIHDHAQFERSIAQLSVQELLSVLGNRSHAMTITVAERNNRLLGYAAMTYDFSLWRARRWAHLDCLFVSENHRGHAVGARLLQYAKQQAAQNGADRLEWQTPSWNDGAIRFYLRQGAVAKEKMRFEIELVLG